MRRGLGRIALMLAVAGFGIVHSPADHLVAAPLDSAPAQPQDGSAKPSPPADDAQAPKPASPDANTAPASTESPALGDLPRLAEKLCKELGGAALENGLPAEFFLRLIWQESRFHTRSVSRKGAKGIAQFMPATARSRGLADPFEPIQSLRHSARWLKELREQFGNLGLAAAAYNSGPRRVQDWLRGHSNLPGETRDYVKTITGRTAEEWVKLGSDGGTTDFALASVIPCDEFPNVLAREPHPPPEREPTAAPEQSAGAIAKVAAGEPHPRSEQELNPAPAQQPNIPSEQSAWARPEDLAREAHLAPERELNAALKQSADANATSGSGAWSLQLTGHWSEQQALAAYRDLQEKFPAILGDRPPVVLRGPIPGRGPAPWYRVRVTESSRERAEELCARLERAGGQCLVVRK